MTQPRAFLNFCFDVSTNVVPPRVTALPPRAASYNLPREAPTFLPLLSFPHELYRLSLACNLPWHTNLRAARDPTINIDGVTIISGEREGEKGEGERGKGMVRREGGREEKGEEEGGREGKEGRGWGGDGEGGTEDREEGVGGEQRAEKWKYGYRYSRKKRV